MKKYFLVLTVFLLYSVVTMSQSANNADKLAKTVAENYGINSWSNVNSLKFTFNVKAKGKNVERSWIWEPKSGKVTYSGKNEKGKDTLVSYNRNNLDPKNASLTSIDSKFINDSYWLLFPFHLVWDSNVDIKDRGIKEFPISHNKGESIIVQYKNNVGYTPNDAFVLFLDKNNMIKEWIYRPGGNKEKERIYTWEGYKKFGRITISTEHYGPDKKTKVWFTDIKIDQG